MNRAKIIRLREIIEAASESLTDDLAVEAVELFPKWVREGKYYEVNDRVQYEGVLYKVLIAHNAQENWTPVDAPSLFARVLIPEPDIIPEWVQPDSTNAYMIGDRVRHYDRIWESLINYNTWEPGVLGTESLWEEID